MSERSDKAFIEAVMAYPEMDDDERMDEYEDDAVYQSSSLDLQDSLGKDNFKYVFPILIQDINAQPFENRRIFCQKMLERVEELYEYTFPETPELRDPLQVLDCYEFIQFLEFNNIIFLSLVWQHLNVNLLELDVEPYCKSNQMKIIKETEEQLESHEQSELISIFLRTYYKEKYIEWFIRETEKSKTPILLEILEREGKLNV